MKDPLLVVVIMVKDEAHCIKKTLLPFVESDIRDICVLDTGSTDATVQIIKDFFQEYKVNGHVDEEAFVDFAISRNRALEYAEKHFPNATFFLMIDADWYIKNADKLLQFCEQEKNAKPRLYEIQVYCGSVAFMSARLFRCTARNRYTGVVHERPLVPAEGVVPSDVYFDVSVDQAHLQKSRSRYELDAKLLLEEVNKNPLDPRTYFYLGQTYQCSNDFYNAYKYYLKRIALSEGCIPEETSVVYFRLGQISQNLAKIDSTYTWEMALDFYLKAFTARPNRIEPLVCLAAHYLKSHPSISFVYASYACSVPYPKNDKYFVQKNIYDFVRFEILSQCAWPMNAFQVGKQATENALKAMPDHDVLQKRLQMYEDALKGRKVPPQTFKPPKIHTISAQPG